MTGCEESQTGLIDQRYVLGPYGTAFLVVFESVSVWDAESSDRRKSVTRLLPVDPANPAYENEILPAITHAMNDPRVTLYRLPPGHVAIVRISEVPDQGFLFAVEQLPPATLSAKGVIGICTGDCPPNSKSCRVGEVPDCSTGTLKCIPRL